MPHPKITRRSVWQAIRSLLLVLLISALVWLWIDLELTAELSKVPLQVPVTADEASGLIVQLVEPADGEVLASFRGSKERLGELESKTRSGQAPEPIVISARHATGLVSLDLERLLQADPNFSGVEITALRPESIQVRVDRWITVPVRVGRLDAGNLAVTDVSFEPAEVPVRIPESVWSSLPTPLEQRVLTARVAPEDIKSDAILGDLPLTLSARLVNRVAGAPVELPIGEVVATFRVLGRVIRYRVVVPILYPIRWMREYDVVIEEPEQTSVELELEGPREIIERIRAGEVTIPAELPFKLGDVKPRSEEEGPIVRDLYITLPPEVTLLKPPPPIRFHLRKRGT